MSNRAASIAGEPEQQASDQTQLTIHEPFGCLGISRALTLQTQGCVLRDAMRLAASRGDCNSKR